MSGSWLNVSTPLQLGFRVVTDFISLFSRNHRLWSSPLDDDTSSHMKRYLFIACFIFISVVTIIIILTRVGHRSSANSNLDTDWKFNPQIKTGQ